MSTAIAHATVGAGEDRKEGALGLVAQAIEDRPRMAFLLLFVFLCLQVRPHWYPTPDSCAYLSMARSVANGEGLLRFGSEHLWYPPGYAVLLSPFFAISDRPFLAINLFHLALAMACAYGVYLWARRLVPEAAILVTLVAVTNVLFCMHYRRTLSELPFMCGLIWMVNLLNYLESRTTRGTAWWGYLLAGLLFAGLCLVRQAGITFVAGFGVMLLLQVAKGQMRLPKAIAVSMLVGLPATLAVGSLVLGEEVTASGVHGRTYLDNFAAAQGDWLSQRMEGLRMEISSIGRVVIPGMFKTYSHAGVWASPITMVYGALFVALCVGWWQLVRRSNDVLLLAGPFYLMLHVAYAMESGARFMVPVAPLLIVCTYAGMGQWQYRRPLLVAVLVVHVGISVAYIATKDIPRASRAADHWAQVEVLSKGVSKGEAIAVTNEFPEHARLMLQFSLDRPVKRVGEQAPEGIEQLHLIEKASE